MWQPQSCFFGFLFDPIICFAVPISLLGNSVNVVVSISIDYKFDSKGDYPFNRIICDDSGDVWDGFCECLKNVPWKNFFNLGASAAAFQFHEMV